MRNPGPRTSELDLIEYVLQFGDAFYPEHHHDSSAGKIRWVFDPTFPTERLRNAILDAEWWRLEEVYSPDYYSTMREEFERSAPSFPTNFPPLILLIEPTRIRIGDGFHRSYLCHACRIPTLPAVVGKYLKDSDVPAC